MGVQAGSTIPSGPQKAGRGGDERGGKSHRHLRDPTRCTGVSKGVQDNMITPHGSNGRGAALTNVPADWWRQKQSVADRVGNALLISLSPPTDVRRVVGLYQQRASDAAPDNVQLKTAASKKDGASIRSQA